ncbi:MAG TPA: DNA-directed RNA polymerase subunit H [Nanoarchaeota archaeon]|nr:DNA-directed RNA polymerase subunit H [Nanoarchaeota archaeon]
MSKFINRENFKYLKIHDKKSSEGDNLTKFNILKHKLVPEHVVLSEEEKRKLLEKYNISEKQLPKILAKDPVVKAIGAKPGDVIKIIRKSPVAGKVIYYRLVIEE